MGKCDKCMARDFFATVFDSHWLGEEDCPIEKCTMDENGQPIPQDEEDADAGKSDV